MIKELGEDFERKAFVILFLRVIIVLKLSKKMKKVNFEILEELVSTQYTDYTGIIKIDGHFGAIDVFKMCEDNGVDIENNFLLAFGLSESTIKGIGLSDKVSGRALLISNSDYGNSYEEIKESIINNGGKVRVNEVTFQILYTDLTKYIKRFNFLAASDLSQYIDSIELES